MLSRPSGRLACLACHLLSRNGRLQSILLSGQCQGLGAGRRTRGGASASRLVQGAAGEQSSELVLHGLSGLINEASAVSDDAIETVH